MESKIVHPESLGSKLVLISYVSIIDNSNGKRLSLVRVDSRNDLEVYVCLFWSQ